jgi:hypothetical protein
MGGGRVWTWDGSHYVPHIYPNQGWKKKRFLALWVSVDPGAKTWTTLGQLCHNPWNRRKGLWSHTSAYIQGDACTLKHHGHSQNSAHLDCLKPILLGMPAPPHLLAFPKVKLETKFKRWRRVMVHHLKSGTDLTPTKCSKPYSFFPHRDIYLWRKVVCFVSSNYSLS